MTLVGAKSVDSSRLTTSKVEDEDDRSLPAMKRLTMVTGEDAVRESACVALLSSSHKEKAVAHRTITVLVHGSASLPLDLRSRISKVAWAGATERRRRADCMFRTTK